MNQSINLTVTDLNTAFANAAVTYRGKAEECDREIVRLEGQINVAYQQFPGGSDPVVAQIEQLKAGRERWKRMAAAADEGFYLIEDMGPASALNKLFPDLYAAALKQHRVRYGPNLG